MNNSTSYLVTEIPVMSESNSKNYHFDSVEGVDDMIEVSVIEDGAKRTVLLIETFNDAQFELFEKLEKKAKELYSAQKKRPAMSL